MLPIKDKVFLQKVAGRAGEELGLIEWNNDLNLIRIYSSLSVAVGSDVKLMYHWMHTPNKSLEGKVPANLITTSQGEMEILSLLNQI